MSATVLIVDDEPTFRVLAQEALTAEGFEVHTAATARLARAEMDHLTPDVVILDRRLPDMDGLEFLKALRAEGPSTPVVIVVTAYGDVGNAVEALQVGAADYLTKPVQLTDLVIKLRKTLEARGLKDRLALARSSAAGPVPAAPASAGMKLVVERLRSVAISPMTPVFLFGSSGVGKQYAAEMLHSLTWRDTDNDAPFVEVNCSALPDELVESELFGHEKGAFTDAKTARRGLIEMAAGGTLFLDEIAELNTRSQAKLLKFIDTFRFRRIGGEREINVQLRLVAATNRDVQKEVEAGRLREDLYHRLAVFTVAIPPLAERREDIAPLCQTFIRYFGARVKKKITGLSPDALAALETYSYPGNVRELRNVIERAVILCRNEEIGRADIILPSEAAAPRDKSGFFQLALTQDGGIPTLRDMEASYVAHVLRHFGGHRMNAVQALGISYPTFLKCLREHESGQGGAEKD